MSKPTGSNKEMFESTRQNFIEKAEQLFATQGFVSTSTSEIVNEAGMARGALYHHFKNKEELFAAVFEEKIKKMQASLYRKQKQLVKDATLTPNEQLIAMFDYTIDTFKRGNFRRIIVTEAIIALPHAHRRAKMREYFFPLFIEQFEKSGLRQHSDEETLDAMIIGLIGFVAESVRSFEYKKAGKELNHHAEVIKKALHAFMLPLLSSLTNNR